MAETTTTYEVFKRKATSSGSYERHVVNTLAFLPGDDYEPAIFDTLEEAYACAATIGPGYETSIKVVETTVRTVEWL